jgi:uncharacterized protein (TIGR02996 family)
MTDREALLRAVCEHPDDDLPRLVLADWLDEHDEPDRAEFIRCEIELARDFGGQSMTSGWMAARETDRHAWLTHRLAILSSRKRMHWWNELPQMRGEWSWGRTTERGFFPNLWLGSSTTLVRRPDLLWVTPLTQLYIEQVENADDLIASIPLNRLHKLELRTIRDQTARDLLDWLERQPRIEVYLATNRSHLSTSTLQGLETRLGTRFHANYNHGYPF